MCVCVVLVGAMCLSVRVFVYCVGVCDGYVVVYVCERICAYVFVVRVCDCRLVLRGCVRGWA